MPRPYSGEEQHIGTRCTFGETFSEPEEDRELIEPVCQGSILRYPSDKGEILFSNPASTRRERMTVRLSRVHFDVLLTHESPLDAIHADSGSDVINTVIRSARPAFAFFGHYHRTGRQVEGDFGPTRVYHLSHLELDSRAEEGSVGMLTWNGAAGDFAYLDPAWLRTVTRHNWKHR